RGGGAFFRHGGGTYGRRCGVPRDGWKARGHRPRPECVFGRAMAARRRRRTPGLRGFDQSKLRQARLRRLSRLRADLETAAFAEDCTRADIIVTPRFAPLGCAAAIVIDREKLKQTGALTL